MRKLKKFECYKKIISIFRNIYIYIYFSKNIFIIFLNEFNS